MVSLDHPLAREDKPLREKQGEESATEIYMGPRVTSQLLEQMNARRKGRGRDILADGRLPVSIYRAAERMVAKHGTEALAEANKEAKIARSERFESLAKTWDLICAGIRDLDDLKHSPEAYKRALGSE